MSAARVSSGRRDQYFAAKIGSRLTAQLASSRSPPPRQPASEEQQGRHQQGSIANQPRRLWPSRTPALR